MAMPPGRPFGAAAGAVLIRIKKFRKRRRRVATGHKELG
jgi:hypothetical protein